MLVVLFRKWFLGKSKERPTARNKTEPTRVFVDLWKPLPPLPLNINNRLSQLDANRGGSPLQVPRGPGDMYPLRPSPEPPSYQQNPFSPKKK